MQVNSKILQLNMDQCIEMAINGYLKINDEIFYRIAKCQLLKDIHSKLNAGDIIAGNKHMFYLLSKNRNHECKSSTPQLHI